MTRRVSTSTSVQLRDALIEDEAGQRVLRTVEKERRLNLARSVMAIHAVFRKTRRIP